MSIPFSSTRASLNVEPGNNYTVSIKTNFGKFFSRPQSKNISSGKTFNLNVQYIIIIYKLL